MSGPLVDGTNGVDNGGSMDVLELLSSYLQMMHLTTASAMLVAAPLASAILIARTRGA
jgi:hypothetical protein